MRIFWSQIGNEPYLLFKKGEVLIATLTKEPSNNVPYCHAFLHIRLQLTVCLYSNIGASEVN